MNHVIVTGAAGGLGICLVKCCLEKGSQVFAIARQVRRNLEELKEQYPQRLYLFEADVADTRSVEEAAQKIAEMTESVDMIFNTVGVLPQDYLVPFEEVSIDGFLSTINTNTLGHLRVMQKHYGLLKKGTSPIVVNISSAGGSFKHIIDWDKRVEYPYAYCMSKAALNMGSAIFQRYGKLDGIRVICVHPGVLDSPMTASTGNLFNDELVLPEDSAKAIFELAERERVKAGGELFFNYDGGVFPY